jgi:Uma2 family endonuclease
MVISERLYSADAFWELAQLPEHSGKRLELVNGEIREKVPAGGEHGEIAFDLGLLVGSYVKQHHLGRVTAAETGYILHTDADTVRAPDVGFVRLERAPEPFAEIFIPLAPDLAIEVVSPGDKAHEIEEKVLDYLSYGVRAVWIVYPSSRTLVIHTIDGMKDMLEGSDILPGFKIAVNEIFPTQ